MQLKVVTTPSRSSGSSSSSTSFTRRRGVFSVEVTDDRPGLIVFEVSGVGAAEAFANEAGGHRWQRVPENDKRGRVHTSTVTVAVLPEPTESELVLREVDLEWSTCRGSGPGGQHRNKTESAVILKHRPTGVQVRCESGRSQHQNRCSAFAHLRARLWETESGRTVAERASSRAAQVGSGMRGDKRRTVRTQDGRVTDHVSGRVWRLRDYLKGEF